ncbi:hypothetical protein [Streptomyces europaeiscabiei]|uniref:hypothetical protein n=1 Tax=Streptomyces europaeiscabiei TaxID=146819 RepID=UPI002E179ABA
MTGTDQNMTAVDALLRFAQRHTDAEAAQALVDRATNELAGRTVVRPEHDVAPIRFYFRRHQDVSGVSGEGRIADGVLWPDGTASLRWRGPHPKIDFCDRGLVTAEHVHGHGGATEIVFIDRPDEQPADAVDPADVPLALRRMVEHALRRPVPCPKCSRTTACRCITDRTEARVGAVLAAIAPWLRGGEAA